MATVLSGELTQVQKSGSDECLYRMECKNVNVARKLGESEKRKSEECENSHYVGGRRIPHSLAVCSPISLHLYTKKGLRMLLLDAIISCLCTLLFGTSIPTSFPNFSENVFTLI